MGRDHLYGKISYAGASMWGYQRHGLDPDIVTMGKPMGNGFPVAGLVARQTILETFGRDTRYFNTFGGNTVAMAAVQATLDVIRDERLLENCEQVGKSLRAGLRELAGRHHQIGEVRGAGLYVGVEFVHSQDTRRPDSALAADVVNGLRERRVLVSSTGPAANVVKIRPPLVFSAADASRVIS